jgi:hypothetical protein
MRWSKILVTISIGSILVGCETSSPIVEPRRGVEYRTSEAREAEFQSMIDHKRYPMTRAWIRHCDEIIRHNNALREW